MLNLLDLLKASDNLNQNILFNELINTFTFQRLVFERKN